MGYHLIAVADGSRRRCYTQVQNFKAGHKNLECQRREKRKNAEKTLALHCDVGWHDYLKINIDLE